ncbi:MAG: discoidin domain-containing protein [Clostridiales bacterium]
MNRSGIITRIKLFYAIVMTYDFKYSRVLRKKGMKLNDNIIFGKKDIFKFRALILFAVIFTLFLNIGLIYGVMNYSKLVKPDNSVYFFIDGSESYQLKLDEELKLYDSSIYENGKYKTVDKFLDSKISNVIQEVIKNDKDTSNVIAISFVQFNENSKNQLKLINNELNNINKWAKNNSNKGNKLIISKGLYSEYTYAKSNNLPIGKYLIYKNSTYVKDSINESDLAIIKLNKMFDFGDEGDYVFSENAFHIDDVGEEATSSPEKTENTIKSTKKSTKTELEKSKIETENPIKTYEKKESNSPENNTSTINPSTTSPPSTSTPETLQNLALNKKVYTSGSILGYDPKYAVDSDLSSSWATFPKNNNWIEIDIGKEKNISSIEVKWSDTNYPKTFSLYRIDNDDLKAIGTYNGSRGVQYISFSKINSRFIHLKMEESNDKYLVIYDLKVMGY